MNAQNPSYCNLKSVLKATTYEPPRIPQSLTLQTPNGLPGIPVTKDGNYTDADGQQWVCDEIDLERGKYVQRVAIEKNNGGLELKPSPDTQGRFFQHNKLTNIFSIALKKSLCNIASFTSWGAPVNDKYAFALNGHSIYFSPPKGAEITAEELNAKLNSLSFPVVFVGELATPIERNLTPEEIAAYKALRTYGPTTVITNDARGQRWKLHIGRIRKMRKYIGTKLIEAEPMTWGQYSEVKALDSKVGLCPHEEGYMVKYSDGYTSWSPKEVFESAYLPVDDNKNLPSGVSIGSKMVDEFIAFTETQTMGDRTTVYAVFSEMDLKL